MHIIYDFNMYIYSLLILVWQFIATFLMIIFPWKTRRKCSGSLFCTTRTW